MVGVDAQIGAASEERATDRPHSIDHDSGVSLEELYDRYHRQGLGLARQIVRRTDVAEEIVLHAYLEIWNSRSDDPSQGSFCTRLMACIRRRAIERLRAQPVPWVTSLDRTFDLLERLDGPRDVGCQNTSAQMRRALARVSPSQRRMLELAYFEGVSRHEIAERVGKPVGAVARELRTALDQIRCHLGASQVDDEAEQRRGTLRSAWVSGRPSHLRRLNAATDGRLLLMLASQDPHDAAPWARDGASDAATIRHHLQERIDTGVIIGFVGPDLMVYQLTPRAFPRVHHDPDACLLVLEDDLVTQDLVVEVVDDWGYTVMASEAPTLAEGFQGRHIFDVAIIDGFNRLASAVFFHADSVFRNAAVTVIAQFSARRLELEQAQAVKLRDLISKPYAVATLLLHVREHIRQ